MDQQADAGPWNKLNPKLSQFTINALSCLGFDRMTPVQSSTIPLFLSNKDVVVEAVTGSGKSLAFIIPIIEMLIRRDEIFSAGEIGAIIISPTRELASQIYDVLMTFIPSENDNLDSKLMSNLKAMLITRGRPISDDLVELKRLSPTILVCTPGKLLELVKQRAINTKQLEVLVLDEADRLLDLGFDATLRQIISSFPKQRRTGLFSATISDGLANLVKAGLRNPVKVVVQVQDKVSKQVQRTPSSLQIKYQIVEAHHKFETLLAILQHHLQSKIIVYFATCLSVDFYHKIIMKLPQFKDHPIFSLHGKKDNQQRPKILQKFNSSHQSILFCTDVAARGIDFPDIDFVLQYDAPQDPQSFLHRCGRSGRFGKSGSSLIFLMPHEDTFVQYLHLKKVPMIRETQVFKFEFEGISTSGSLPPYYDSEGASDLEKFIHYVILKDRAYYDCQVGAFVSYLKSYKEHQLKYIFPFEKLPLDGIMSSYLLLCTPSSPEITEWKQKNQLKDNKFQNFIERVDKKNIKEIKFAEKAREVKRQKMLQERQNSSNKIHKKQNEAWSKTKETKLKRAERNMKKDKKRQAILLAKMNEMQHQAQVTASSDNSDLDDDYREYKREKKSKSMQFIEHD